MGSVGACLNSVAARVALLLYDFSCLTLSVYLEFAQKGCRLDPLVHGSVMWQALLSLSFPNKSGLQLEELRCLVSSVSSSLYFVPMCAASLSIVGVSGE